MKKVADTISVHRLAGTKSMAIRLGLVSCASEIQQLIFQMDGRIGCLIDTPGFDDTYLSDTEVLEQIANWLALTYDLSRLHDFQMM